MPPAPAGSVRVMPTPAAAPASGPAVSGTSGAPSRRQSRLLVNTGTGKGKSSAAFGVMGRAWARGWQVAVVQFLKSEKWRAGERKLADHLGIEWHALGDGFTWESTDMEETIARGRHAWDVAAEKVRSGAFDLVILDEVTYVMTYGWVPVDEVVAVLAERPARTNIIATGRYAPAELIAIADTVTDMTLVKHAMQAGIGARKGIEY
jgi:cob(I)alamin adenosyltransferase